MKKAINIFLDIAQDCNSCEDIKEQLRSICSFGDITQKEYDFIIQNWDNILEQYNL